MTLKEKFGELYIEKGMSFECEVIANEFAIGFSKWVHDTKNRLGYHETKNEWFVYNLDKWITPEELLEIYKKETGL